MPQNIQTVYKVCKIKKGQPYSAVPMYRQGRGPAVKYEVGQQTLPIVKNSPLMAFQSKDAAMEFAENNILSGSWNENKTFGVFRATAELYENQQEFSSLGILEIGRIQVVQRKLIRYFWNKKVQHKTIPVSNGTIFCKWVGLTNLVYETKPL